MLRTGSKLVADCEALFEQFNLSQPSHNVLRIIAGHEPKGVACNTITDHLITRGPDITRLLDRLEKRGLVRRGSCDEDGRRRISRLTDQGREAVEQLKPLLIDLHRRQFGGLSSDETSQLLRLLQKVRDSAAKLESRAEGEEESSSSGQDG